MLVLLGTLFLKRFKNAMKMADIQTEIFTQLMATFTPDTTKKWEEMVVEWNVNPKNAPNPYREPCSGNYLVYSCSFFKILISIAGTTLQDVRLVLAKEEAAQAALGQIHQHKTSLSSFLMTDFELEDRQCVKFNDFVS